MSLRTGAVCNFAIRFFFAIALLSAFANASAPQANEPLQTESLSDGDQSSDGNHPNSVPNHEGKDQDNSEKQSDDGSEQHRVSRAFRERGVHRDSGG